jgi:hypothetical protein
MSRDLVAESVLSLSTGCLLSLTQLSSASNDDEEDNEEEKEEDDDKEDDDEGSMSSINVCPSPCFISMTSRACED